MYTCSYATLLYESLQEVETPALNVPGVRAHHHLSSKCVLLSRSLAHTTVDTETLQFPVQLLAQLDRHFCISSSMHNIGWREVRANVEERINFCPLL